MRLYPTARPVLSRFLPFPSLALAVLICLFGFSSVGAQDPTFTFTASSVDMTYNPIDGVGEVCIEVSIDDENDPGDTDSFTMALAHDDTLLVPISLDAAGVLADINGGEGPDVFLVDLVSGSTPGVTAEVVYSDTDDVVISFADSAVVLEVCYETVADTLIDDFVGMTTDLDFSELGDPAVGNEVTVGDEVFVADVVGGEITLIPDQNLGFTFSVENRNIGYDIETGEGAAGLFLRIEEDPDHVDYPSDTQGFSVSLSYDSTYLEAMSVNPSGPLTEINDGEGPDFFEADLDVTDGLVLGVIYETFLEVTVVFENQEQVAVIDFETVPDELIDDDVGVTTTLAFEDGLSDPPVSNRINVDLEELTVETVDASIILEPRSGLFLRGDCDGSGDVFAIIDVLYLLLFGFAGGPAPPCMKAADTNDNGDVFAIIDGLYLLQWQFTGGQDPPAPGPEECGTDPTDDDLTCDTSPDSC